MALLDHILISVDISLHLNILWCCFGEYFFVFWNSSLHWMAFQVLITPQRHSLSLSPEPLNYNYTWYMQPLTLHSA